MDVVGRWTTLMIERLWRSVKYEEVYLKDYQNPQEAYRGLRDYFRFYNKERIHQSHGYKTPEEVYYQ
jgi:putative transposase